MCGPQAKTSTARTGVAYMNVAAEPLAGSAKIHCSGHDGLIGPAWADEVVQAELDKQAAAAGNASARDALWAAAPPPAHVGRTRTAHARADGTPCRLDLSERVRAAPLWANAEPVDPRPWGLPTYSRVSFSRSGMLNRVKWRDRFASPHTGSPATQPATAGSAASAGSAVRSNQIFGV